MKIELVDISSIKPYENNPRKLSEKAIEKVALSLKEYGFRQVWAKVSWKRKKNSKRGGTSRMGGLDFGIFRVLIVIAIKTACLKN